MTHSVRPVDGQLEVTVTSTLKINYGDYEAHHVFAAAKGVFDADADPDEVGRYLDEKVFSFMAPQLEAAKDFAIRESFVRKIETE